MAEQRRPLQQAKVLTVATVRHLEHEVLEAEAVFDRLLAGGALLALYGRLRHSDLARLTSLSW
eukprot:8357093-Lingulodinium_polyedra.AAC.1